MTSFNVLDPNTPIDQNYFLEASAGTGKTFTIENIVVRLLLEKKLPLEKILIVTFTKAATSDLKVRVRQNIEKTLEEFNRKEVTEEVKSAKRLLEQALFGFSGANIFTIHSFCAKMLQDFVFEGDLALDAIQGDETLANRELIAVIRDFFRTELTKESYAKCELKKLTPDQVEQQLFSFLKSGMPVRQVSGFNERFILFKEVLKELKTKFKLNIVEEFLKVAPFYKGFIRQIKEDDQKLLGKIAEIFQKNECSYEDFEFLIEDKLSLFSKLNSSNISKKGIEKEISPPLFFTECVKKLTPFLSMNQSFAKMVADCKHLLERRLLEDEKLTFDDLLKNMQNALDNPSFLEKVQQSFEAAIIDEFQDTDPVQWDVFYKLFLKEKRWTGNLYLVGDPKQSIYGFRQADIYSYLKAADSFDENAHATLDTNYRSSPDLIDALNAVFDVDHLFKLPQTNKCLTYHPVKFSDRIKNKEFPDSFGALHFFGASCKKFNNDVEQEYYYPFIAQEIQKLGPPYNQYAILVSDRFQADKVADFCEKYNIPVVKQRTSSLAKSQALPSLQEFLKALLYTHHDSTLKTALASPIIGFTHEEIKKLDDQFFYETVLAQMIELKQELLTNGFSDMASLLLQSSWHEDNLNVTQRLLSQERGLEFYTDLIQLIELLIEEQSKHQSSIESLIAFLDSFDELEIDEDDRLKKRSDPEKEAVQILTIHSSKGLEYDCVFALGLIKRPSISQKLIPALVKGKRELVAVTDKESKEYLEFCHELDAEKMRQLYVALTRAKYRVYCPFVEESTNKKSDPGRESPMDLFETLVPDMKQKNDKISYTLLNDISFDLKVLAHTHKKELKAPNSFSPDVHERYMTSFSSLLKQKKTIDTIEGVPRDFQSEVKTAHTLPAGNQTGLLLHKVLEELSFNLVKECQTPHDLTSHILPYVQNSRFEPWCDVICDIIFNTLKTPLIEGFCLCECQHLFKEIDFLYQTKDGLMKGIIDLVFEYNGKVYIVDWKSNWLGSTYDDYTQQALKNAMNTHHYDMQAEIYHEALKRYLKFFKDWEIGGVYYIFLRGLNSESANRTGVYING